MTDREMVAAFTRGAMARIRELAGVPEETPVGVTEGLGKYSHGWEYVLPGMVYEFRGLENAAIYSSRYAPSPAHRYRLDVRTTAASRNTKGDFLPIAFCRDKAEAEQAIALYMRGVDLDAQFEGDR